MPEKFTPTEFKRTLKATTNEILEKNFAVHEAHEALRSFTNKEWRKVNEDVLGSRAKIVELQGNLGKIKMKGNAGKSYFNNEPDGDFGLKTLSALLLFQRDYGLEDDGIAGDNTLKMIQKVLLGDQIVTPGFSGTTSLEIQKTEIPHTLKGFILEKTFIQFFNPDVTFNKNAQNQKLYDVLSSTSGLKGIIQTGIGEFEFQYDFVTGKYVYINTPEHPLLPHMLKTPVIVGEGHKITFLTRMPDEVATESKRERNRLFLEKSVPIHWKDIGKQFFEKLEKDDVINERTPIQLFDVNNRRGVLIFGGKIREFGIIDGGASTPKGVLHHVNEIIVGNTCNDDASLKGSSTVRGATFISPEGVARGGKWAPHGVDKSRDGWGSTAGCIGMESSLIHEIASEIVSSIGTAEVVIKGRTRYINGDNVKYDKKGKVISRVKEVDCKTEVKKYKVHGVFSYVA